MTYVVDFFRTFQVKICLKCSCLQQS